MTHRNRIWTLNNRFEALTAVTIKSSIFRVIIPCIPLKVKWHFGGTYYLNLQGRRVSQARNQKEGGSMFLAWLSLRSWRWKRHVPPKRQLTFTGLHGVTFQKTYLVIGRHACVYFFLNYPAQYEMWGFSTVNIKTEIVSSLVHIVTYVSNTNLEVWGSKYVASHPTIPQSSTEWQFIQRSAVPFLHYSHCHELVRWKALMHFGHYNFVLF
jgi:hypothetical protein